MSLLEWSVCGAVFILAAALLRAAALRRLPKGTFVALWWAAAVRLLVPFRLPAPCSVYTLLKTLTAKPQAVSAVPQPAEAVPPVIVLPVQPLETVPAAPAPEPAVPVWELVWLAVAFLLAVWFLTAYLRWRLRFWEALPLEGRGLPAGVRLRVSDRIKAPLTYGLIRPVVLLPRTMDLTDKDALDCVLAHESAHIRRLDGLLKPLLAAALCVHWFNPAVWLLYALANRDMELRCDEAAVRSLGEDRRELYALTLIRMTELQSVSVPLCSGFSESGMEERIKAIMSIKKRSVFAVVSALALVVCVTGAFATSAWEAQAEGTKKEEVLTPLERLEESVRYDGGNVYFTIPESEGRWNIWISGRIATEDGMGMSVRYLERESEQGEWAARMTYSFALEDAAYEELLMSASCGGETRDIDLSRFLPEGGAPLAPAELPEGKPGIPEGAAMIWPADSVKITNSFGARTNPGGEGTVSHNGVDIGGLEQGAPVYAAAAGTVKDTGFSASDGNYVRLDHGDGLETYYAHCQSVFVKTGDPVALGQTIAAVGQTGMAAGPHLHFEIILNGERQNPEVYLQAAQNSAPAGLAVGKETNTDLPGDTPEEDSGEYILGSSSKPAPETEPVAAVIPQGQSQSKGEVMPQEMSQPQEEEMPKLSLEAQEAAARMNQAVEKAKEDTRRQLVNGDYPRNSQGETYGNVYGYDLVGYEPDLLAAVGFDAASGEEKNGYVASAEFIGPYTSTPEEAVAYMNWKEENHITGHEIPLYDEEHNVIGIFQIGGGGPGCISYEAFLEAKRQGWPNSNGSTPVEREPLFKTIEEAQEAVLNGWTGAA